MCHTNKTASYQHSARGFGDANWIEGNEQTQQQQLAVSSLGSSKAPNHWGMKKTTCAWWEQRQTTCVRYWKYRVCVAPAGQQSNSHFLASWMETMRKAGMSQGGPRMMKRDETTLPARLLPFCSAIGTFFIISPLGYWFSFLSAELVGPASRPPRSPRCFLSTLFHSGRTHTHGAHTRIHTHTHNKYCVYTQGAKHANTYLKTHPDIFRN